MPAAINPPSNGVTDITRFPFAGDTSTALPINRGWIRLFSLATGRRGRRFRGDHLGCSFERGDRDCSARSEKRSF